MSSVLQIVRKRLPTLPRAEADVARALVADYPAAGLSTVASLANAAGVSAPTVLRLVDRLGFSGFAAFQDALRSELQQRQLTPIEQYAEHVGSGEPLLRSPATFNRAIGDTFAQIDPVAFRTAVKLIASPKHRVCATGGRFTSVLAKNLVQQLEVLRPATQYLSVEDRTSALTDIGARDVVFAIDLPRYQPSTVEFSEQAAALGAKIVLLTDRYRSPIARQASVVLSCSVQAPHPLDSMVPAMAVVEALLAGVVDALGTAPLERMKRYDAAWEGLGFGRHYGERLGQGASRTRTKENE